MSRIDILLATYNGARFLPEQLASLAAQTHTDWRLLVRDDGSRDNSVEIVRDWAKGVPQTVEIVEDGRTGLGASLNFAALLEQSDAPYFAFCDQDDVWLPEKLELMLRLMHQFEHHDGADKPLLAFCDLAVVDEQMQELSSSFWHASRLPMTAETLRPNQIMVRNPVTGCATLGNAALRNIGLPIPADARMHDWWLALVAGAGGGLRPVPKALVRYRQHRNNVVGAMDSGTLSLLQRFGNDPADSMQRAALARDRSQRQARAFVRHYETEENWLRVMAEYGNLSSRNFWRRKLFLVRHRLGIHSPLYFLALLAVI